ncbi:MAG: vitamin B12 dependent-methionine synthase activation domain-containing protein, partial [Lysobacteraceae bacterium]
VQALGVRIAEGLAELLHQRARAWCGFGKTEDLSHEQLIREQYRGIRPAPGYPACPEHSEKRTIFDLLQAEDRIGLSLTENFAMYPASAVSGLYFSHPDSQYFVVGRLSREQVADYAKRKGIPLEQAERWLAPNLDYDPD